MKYYQAPHDYSFVGLTKNIDLLLEGFSSFPAITCMYFGKLSSDPLKMFRVLIYLIWRNDATIPREALPKYCSYWPDCIHILF